MNIDGKTKIYGIMANPVAHSMSPLLQNLYAERTKVNACYVPFQVEQDDVKAAMEGAFALHIQGMNVTVPHKEAVIPYLSEIDETAAAVGAVNTLVRTEHGYKGYNTDVPGLLRAMTEAGIVIRGRSCIVIGAGGAAKAAVYMLVSEGAAVVYVLNRSMERAEELAAYMNSLFGKTAVIPLPITAHAGIPQGRYLAIQTTSVGMHPDTASAPITDPDFYDKIEEAVDVIYTPSETRFMKLVEAHGGRAVNGLYMLLYQGVRGFELWNPGVQVEAETVEEARALIEVLLLKNQKKQSGNILLIGFMGAGKTNVGACYAAAHMLPMVDTDKLIEISSGMSITRMFAEKGEAEFRRRETAMLRQLLDTETVVPQKTMIATGGGLPVKEENRALLRQLGTVIYLRTSVDTVLERLKGDTQRPLLQGDNVREKVEQLMALRDPIYLETAHGVIDTDGRTPEAIAVEIERIEAENKINP